MVDEELSRADLATLARLHIGAMPDATTSLFGQHYGACLYRYLARSPDEFVQVARLDGRLVGGCVLSLRPATLARRLVLSTPLLWAAVLRPVQSLRLLGRVVIRPRGRAQAASVSDEPELLYIFVEPGLRGQAYGTRLLAGVEAFLSRRSLFRYHIRTFNDDDHPAVRFYRRHGFATTGVLRLFDYQFRLMAKTITQTSDGKNGPITISSSPKPP